MKSESDSLPSSSLGGTLSGHNNNQRGGCESVHCEFDAVCEQAKDGFPRCTCQFNCSNEPKIPVCGSNLRLYSSECEMRRDGCQRQTKLRPRPLELCEGPFSGFNNNSYSFPNCIKQSLMTTVQRSINFSAVNTKVRSRFKGILGLSDDTSRGTTSLTIIQPCIETINGCCPDGVTAAKGPNHFGCHVASTSSPSESICHCNKLGSISEECDLVTQECQCRRGVGGPKCDRCLPGFWGLTMAHEDGHRGCKGACSVCVPFESILFPDWNPSKNGEYMHEFCILMCVACGCSRFGSIREDCEQMTGKCVCKAGVEGHKCDSCGHGEYLGPYGCTKGKQYTTTQNLLLYPCEIFAQSAVATSSFLAKIIGSHNNSMI